MPPNDLALFLILILFFSIPNLPSISANIRGHCNRFCGGNSVQYPFGFSDGCEIPLKCSNSSSGGEIRIGDFGVKSITSDAILIDIPSNCGRRIRSISKLFGSNFAPTWYNGLLLQNCSSNISGCLISTSVLERKFELESCGPKSSNISCYAKEVNEGFLGLDNVTNSGCQVLFSSVVVGYGEGRAALSLDFQRLELGWWIEGTCSRNGSCSLQANCTDMTSPVNGRKGFRCRCVDGYKGDGFRAGDGCQKVNRNCNPSKYISRRCGRTIQLGVMIGGIVAGASLVAALAFLCCYIRRCSTTLKSRRSARLLLSEAAGSCTIPFYSYKEIERATNGFSEKERLGTGAYGTVYAGKLHNEEWVAIKKIRHRDSIEQVMNEIRLISSVSHPNLVRLLGYCIERGEQMLVYEFMPNGTLSQHLQGERGSGLPWTTRLTIAVDTANAIAYLHSALNPPIYHRDIKSSNILLDYKFNSKVADFGLSRMGLTESSHISTAPQGTPGYVDPQYHQNFHLSDKSDVYSFGVVLVEIITALKVVDFSRVQDEVNLAKLAIDKIGKGCVHEIIDPFLEPNSDTWTLSSIHKVAELAFRCLAYHRDMRPSMMEVAAELEQIRRSGWTHMEDDLGSCDSSCSSPLNGSKKLPAMSKTTSMESRRLVKDLSPVSVEDPWFSEQSSPSSNSLLDNAIQ
ncbi:wall-associated receptor kinase-like 14 [Magnolia sinica]|uniref:wall-associated receptor kinase-like 14 n=1 Tax=Magnolia sinica TaxID=86752 RepID=UPI00265AE28C|nr:wall-associated receptor kinase-like 14 [Magnolia sinica]XP_058080286.1 wall-associated receptor kinase-like 14 [Magnolia sinica]XP_058080287.1 wall-associated receptor kinase-like 14 [Magnolia sinica]XP_058080288.1 wall-associated receptor kinase-like 14 [Magnolia sinica]